MKYDVIEWILSFREKSERQINRERGDLLKRVAIGAALAAVVVLLAGCWQSSGDGIASRQEVKSEPEQYMVESEPESENDLHPPDALNALERAGDDHWKVIVSEWALTDQGERSDVWRVDANTVTSEYFPTSIEPPYISGEDGELRQIPDTIVTKTTHPTTGKSIIRTVFFTGEYAAGSGDVYDYVVEFEGTVLSEDKNCVPGPGSDGSRFAWADGENIVSIAFSPKYLYNIVNQTYLPLTWPPSEPRKELAPPKIRDRGRDPLIYTDCTFLDAKSRSYIVTHIDGTELEDPDYAKDYGAGRQTLYHINWETGESFPFYENDYRPQGAGRPEYLSIGYQFEDDGNFIFIMDNRYNLAGLGEEIGQLMGYVDVANQNTTVIMEVPLGVMYGGTYGDCVVFITSFYSESDYYVYLYNYRERTVVREFRGELHGNFMGKYPVFLNREKNVVSIFDPDKRKEYQLDLETLRKRLSSFEVKYNVHSLSFDTATGSYWIDYETVLGLKK